MYEKMGKFLNHNEESEENDSNIKNIFERSKQITKSKIF